MRRPDSADERVASAASLRVVQIVPTLEREASGPSQSVPQLAEALRQAGHSVRVESVGATANALPPELPHNSYPKDFARVPVLSALWFSRGLRRGLMEAAAAADVVHSNGLWVMPNVYPAWASTSAGKPLVLSPRGTLSPTALARSSVRKRAFWLAQQGAAVRRARMLHATSEQEYTDIRRFGLRQPVAVIPNGIALPDRPEKQCGDKNLRRLLFLGRLHPIKGLELLISAWAEVASRHLDWELRIVGPGEPTYEAKLKQQANALHAPRLTFAGARYGDAKGAEYRAADIYILPSHSENFAMSVAESLAHGLPVITTHGTPWRGLAETRSGWWIPAERAAIASTLEHALSLSRDELRLMGQRGRSWMTDAYAWPSIAEQMAEAYAWLLGLGPSPPTVVLD